MTLREQFENFEPKKKGLISIQCGGYSMYLGNFLNAAGINSYSFEIPDLHILRLVYDRSKKKYYLIDAQFLRILTDNNGELIDIRDALQRIKRFRDNKALDIGVLWKSIAYPDCSRHIVSNCTCIYSSTTWNFGKKSKLYSINNSNVLQDAIYSDEAIPHILYFKDDLEAASGDDLLFLLQGITNAPIELHE
jgi:hypothetical protein